jgi:hypothetical protein
VTRGPIAGREMSGRAGSFANRKCVDLRRWRRDGKATDLMSFDEPSDQAR